MEPTIMFVKFKQGYLIKSPNYKLLLEDGNSYVEVKNKNSTYGLTIREHDSNKCGNIEITNDNTF